MKIASITELKSRFRAFVDASTEGPVVVTRNGRPVAVLLAVEDKDELDRLVLAHSRRFKSILDAARGQIAAGRGIPHGEFWGNIKDDVDRAPRTKTTTRPGARRAVRKRAGS
jgi:prevent-host-death family protein